MVTTSQAGAGAFGPLRPETGQSHNAGFFTDGTNGTADDYAYDATGNLTKDLNKGITSIAYNLLNLPQTVTTPNGPVAYTYTAGGQKLRATFPGTPAKTYDYVGGLVYEGGKLEFVPTAEGRVLPPGRAINPALTLAESYSNTFPRHEYQIKDHLGNLRVACRCMEVANAISPSQGYGPVVVQEEQYDPWGLSLTGLSSGTVATPSRFKYINREEQQGLGWIDLMARQYDGQIGRFTGVDPVTENQEHLTSYQYGWNNPILKSDPTGKCPECPDGGDGLDAARIGMMVGAAFVQAGRSFKTIAYNAGDFLGITPIEDGKKWEAVEVRRADGTYGSEMQQVQRQGLSRDVGGHILDGANVASAIPSGGAGGMMAQIKSVVVASTSKAIKEALDGAATARKAVFKGQAPKGVDRIDTRIKTDPNGKTLHGQQPHAHLDKDGKRALNQDGTWKHGGGDVKEEIMSWLKKHGWNEPKNK